MTTFWALSFILFLLMLLIGGKRGAKSFFALYVNILILIITVFLLYFKVNPILLALIVSILISAFNLYFINGIHLKTNASFLSISLVMCLLFLLTLLFTMHLGLQGFSEEEWEEIGVYSLHIGINFYQIAVFTTIIAAVGAILDTTISVASSIYEYYTHFKEATFKDLYANGLAVGKGILSATSTTLFFAYLGSYLTLIIWLITLNYSLLDTLNSKVFGLEIIATLIGGIGVIVAVPVTAYITSYLIKKQR